jgi:hypothetical protein
VLGRGGELLEAKLILKIVDRRRLSPVVIVKDWLVLLDRCLILVIRMAARTHEDIEIVIICNDWLRVMVLDLLLLFFLLLNLLGSIICTCCDAESKHTLIVVS